MGYRNKNETRVKFDLRRMIRKFKVLESQKSKMKACSITSKKTDELYTNRDSFFSSFVVKVSPVLHPPNMMFVDTVVSKNSATDAGTS